MKALGGKDVNQRGVFAATRRGVKREMPKRKPHNFYQQEFQPMQQQPQLSTRKLGGIHAYTCECCGEIFPDMDGDLCAVCEETIEQERHDNSQFGAGA